MARTRIKVCGIRTPDDALAAVDAGADALGFVFTRRSPRFIDPAEAAEILAGLPPFVASIAVLANTPLETFMEIEETCPTHATQLQGNEDESLVAACAPVIKGVRWVDGTIAQELARWDRNENVEAILVDVVAAGRAVDWAAMAPALDEIGKPVILSGDLDPANVGEAVRALRPYAVDVAAGVESAPGVKDFELIEAFCRAVRQADED